MFAILANQNTELISTFKNMLKEEYRSQGELVY